MKETLEKHEEEMTSEESSRVWAVLYTKIQERRSAPRLKWIPLAASFLVIVGVVTVLQWTGPRGSGRKDLFARRVTRSAPSMSGSAPMMLPPASSGKPYAELGAPSAQVPNAQPVPGNLSSDLQDQLRSIPYLPYDGAGAGGAAAGGSTSPGMTANPAKPLLARHPTATPLMISKRGRPNSPTGSNVTSTLGFSLPMDKLFDKLHPQTPRSNSVGGTDPVNGEAFDAMFFEHYGVNPFVDPEEDRLATFAVDVDNASYAMARAYLDRGELPPADAIRVEEFVNAFRHAYSSPRPLERADRAAAPIGEEAFAIHLDAAPSPFGKNLTLLRVGLKGREISFENRKPAILTFIVDVSGSMHEENRLELVKKSLFLLLDEMNDDDQVGLVVYGDDARVLLTHRSLEDRRAIEAAIATLRPEGSTNAEAGLIEGYRLADGAYRKGFINRVILCSDGVANVGMTGADDILKRIHAEAGRGIEMSAIGFGMGNYNDVLMEKLADQGDGNYYYVDDVSEARRVFVENLTGTLQTIAKQVKIQVDFNPDAVRRYRLLGYENRDVADRDFRNDRVDAGEIGAGHEVTALFEVRTTSSAAADSLATVRIRYEDPENGAVREVSRSLLIGDVRRAADEIDPSFRMDAAVAEFAEILRGSYWAREGSLASVETLLGNVSPSMEGRSDVEELRRLVRKAERLRPAAAGEGSEPDPVRPKWSPDRD